MLGYLTYLYFTPCVHHCQKASEVISMSCIMDKNVRVSSADEASLLVVPRSHHMRKPPRVVPLQTSIFNKVNIDFNHTICASRLG
jgi:hypothetical protein